jgi:branched-chain amino acid transport system substrate-binding protein
MMNAVRDLGLREAGIHIVSAQDLLPDEELPKMGDTPLGLITAGNYSTAAQRPANQAFLAAWTRNTAISRSPTSSQSMAGMGWPRSSA